jgi:hypothetical protein
MVIAIVLLLILSLLIQKENLYVANSGSLPVEVTYHLPVVRRANSAGWST